MLHLGIEDRWIGVKKAVNAILLDEIIPVVKRWAIWAGME
jgi:hypothetical protein